jgi:tetratricopeptide (TPR) repeat protein
MLSTLILSFSLLLSTDGDLERWEEWVELGLHRLLLSEAEEILTDSTAAPELFALAARAAHASGLKERAESWLARAEGPAIELESARRLLEEDRIEEALALLLAPSGAPRPRHANRADGWMLSARALSRAGELERALPLLKEMIARFPHDDEAPAAYHLLSQAAIARGDIKSARSLRVRANSSARWRSFFDARRRQAIEHPEDPLPRFGVAALWMEVDEAQRARTVLNALLLRAPDFARGHALHGDASRALGELDESLLSWSRALELNENLHAARLNRSILLSSRSKWSEARADLEILITQEESRTEPIVRAHLELAKVLEALGDEDGAAASRANYQRLTSGKSAK